jgi:hypothetical protein
VRNQYRFMKPPAPIRRAKLDNVALVPGNLLPQIHRRQHPADNLPKDDELLIVLPMQDGKQRKTAAMVATMLRKDGHHVRVVQESELNAKPGQMRLDL